MCGLSAIVDFSSADGLLDALLAMHDQIPHRGPDGEGFCVIDSAWQCIPARSIQALHTQAPLSKLRAGLAFRWLKIQDSSEAAAQPMVSQDGATRLLFNGEIYNYRELRDELVNLGDTFRSASDTEVVLAAYERWGTGMFRRLDGMWAIVLLDLPARKLIMSRDRFGIKPLYYYRRGSRLVIASEVKQLLAAGAPPVANVSAVTRFIRGARPEGPEETFFDAIVAQPAATYAEVDLQGPARELTFNTYWHLASSANQIGNSPTLEATCGKLDGLLTRSVAEHMVGPVPMGILASGGLDSSIVAALSAAPFAERGERGAGFSMVVDRSHGQLDETSHIRRVLSAFGFRGFTVELTPSWLKANIGRVSRAQEEPVAGVAVAGQYLAFELAARHGMRIVLDGQGADELFAGYPRHQVVYLRNCVQRRAWGELLSEVLALLRRDRRLFRKAWETFVIAHWRRLFGPEKNETVNFIRDGIQSRTIRASSPSDSPGGSVELAQDTGLRGAFRRDVLTGNLRAVLAVTDRNAMAHAIEARVPYLDRRVVEFAFALPDRYKVGMGQRKRVLRAVGARHLPPEIVSRVDRVGFGAPIHQWLKRHFTLELKTLSDNSVFRDSFCIDSTRMRGFIDAYLSGHHQDAGTVWRLYAVDQWARAYAVTGL